MKKFTVIATLVVLASVALSACQGWKHGTTKNDWRKTKGTTASQTK